MKSVELKLWYSCKSAIWLDHIRKDTIVTGKLFIPVEDIVVMECADNTVRQTLDYLRP